MTLAFGPDGALGSNVAVGGKMGSGGMTVAQPLDVFVEPDEAARLAAAITLMFREEGSREKRTRTRLAFLLEDWGAHKFRLRLEERWGAPLTPAGRDARHDYDSDHLGLNRQRQEGLHSVGLCVPTRSTCADDMAELARLAETYGSSAIRLTVGQNVIIADVPEGNLPALLAEPLRSRLSPEPDPSTGGMVSCTGNDYCNLALIETKSVSRRIVEALDACYPNAAPLRMYWSGCPAGCGNHRAGDIGFESGKTKLDGEVVDAVTIFAGRRTGPNAREAEKIMEQVPVSKLNEVLPTIIANFSRTGRG